MEKAELNAVRPRDVPPPAPALARDELPAAGDPGQLHALHGSFLRAVREGADEARAVASPAGLPGDLDY
eukprot:1677158-Pyramimonas_sp.AAC.1